MTTPEEQPEIIQKTIDAIAIELGIAGPDASGRNAATRNFLLQQLRTLYDEAKKESVFADEQLGYALAECLKASERIREEIEPFVAIVERAVTRQVGSLHPTVLSLDSLIAALTEISNGVSGAAGELVEHVGDLYRPRGRASRDGRPVPIEQNPVVGRTVHYTTLHPTPVVLPAIVCEVHSDLMLTIAVLNPPPKSDLSDDRPTPGFVQYFLVVKTLHEAGTDQARGCWSWPKFF